MPERDWDQHYAKEDLPWDTGMPDPHLVELVEGGALSPGRVLEIGCGTGTNSIWLAARGFDVLGIDVAPLAIERARAKGAGSAARFEVGDFLVDDLPAPHFDLVFDRGVFHVFDSPAAQREFARRVALVLAPAGRWLSIAGSTEGPARDHGPPRRSALDLVSTVEPVLELLLLRSSGFDAHLPSPAMAWVMLARRRAIPAQPSTGGT